MLWRGIEMSIGLGVPDGRRGELPVPVLTGRVLAEMALGKQSRGISGRTSAGVIVPGSFGGR